jgi:hypothetical protein
MRRLGWVVLLAGCAGGGASSTGAAPDDAAAVAPVTDLLAPAVDEAEAAPPDLAAPDDAAPDDAAPPPLACDDPGPEPDEREVEATPLPDINDCDSNGSSVSGVVAGASDVDFFHFVGTDTIACVVDPTAMIDAAGLRLCVFLSCRHGATNLKGCPSGDPALSPAGFSGCCSTSGTVQASISCFVGDDSADVYLSVAEPVGDECVPYRISYHY